MGVPVALFLWAGRQKKANEPTLREINLRRFAPAVRFVNEESMDENAVELEVVRRKRGWLVTDRGVVVAGPFSKAEAWKWVAHANTGRRHSWRRVIRRFLSLLSL
jgi:hypothetical protein